MSTLMSYLEQREQLHSRLADQASAALLDGFAAAAQLGETGPAGARIEFRAGVKQRRAARRSTVGAVAVLVHIATGERRLGAVFA